MMEKGPRHEGQAQAGAVAKEVNPRNDGVTITPVAPKCKESVMKAFIIDVVAIAVFIVWLLFHNKSVREDLDDYNGTGPDA